VSVGRWRSALEHPLLRLELRRIHRKRWWPGRRFFLFYPALLGAVLGCGVVAALSDSRHMRLATLAASAPALCLLNAAAGLLSLALPWIAPALTATSIARERETGTLDLLRVTFLTERSIVLGKLGGCLAWLWPGILTLALLTPFRLSGVAGGVLLDPSYLPALSSYPGPSPKWSWVWVVLTGVAGLLEPWAHLALHVAVGMFVSVLSRSSGVAIAVSYGATIVLRVALALTRFLLNAALVMVPGVMLHAPEAMFDEMLLLPSLTSLGTILAELAGAALLVAAAARWLRRM
jgi:hypothetical protein